MYDRAFYEVSEGGMVQSAQVLVPQIIEWVGPITNMIDVGCGRGWWAKEFSRNGVTALGIDGEYVDEVVCDFRAVNLEKIFPHLGTFDLALCLEVAEHLSPERADTFVHDLCKLAPTIVFSAAIPGQGGTGHVNEQPPEYWAKKFRAEGYYVTGDYRMQIWDDPRIENWYRQNLLVARRPTTEFVWPWEHQESIPTLVHPVLFDHVRSKL